MDIHCLLQSPLAPDSAAFAPLATAYRRWYEATVDLPGTYYLEVVDRLYRQNALARGRFVALGHTIDLARLDIPLYLLAARDDELVAPQQLFAAEHLVGTPADHIVKAVAPCRHLSLFMGKDVLGEYWPAITRWLDDTSLCDAGTRTAAAH